MLWSGNARIGGMMKKIFIVLTFVFISLLSYSKEPLEVEIKIFLKKRKLNWALIKEVALGLIKIKEKIILNMKNF